MSVNGDVSEQVVRLSLEGFEVLARLTLVVEQKMLLQ